MNMKKILAAATMAAALSLTAAGVAHADCHTTCYDGGANGEQCDSSCD